MFEQLTHDPGEQGLDKAARIFYILAVFNLIAIPASFVLYGSRPALLVLMVVISLASALVAYIVARGIERQQNWAKWLGTGFAVLTMLNVPIGTIVGVVTLVYLNRAAKSGLFATGGSSASGASSVTPQDEGAAVSSLHDRERP